MIINIPEKIKKVRFDIGLSYCAPNSAIWLNNDTENTFVIGIEPNKFACETIKKNGLIESTQNKYIKYPHPNFLLLEIALDNVKEKTKKNFYHMGGDVGVSSLLKPTKNLKYPIQEISEVNVYSFSEILSKIDWDRFEYVELVKIDTQGKDLDILKSAEEYLNKIVYINCEINTFQYYENNPKPQEFDDFFEKNGFIKIKNNSFVDGEVVDATYFNKRYSDLGEKINYFVL